MKKALAFDFGASSGRAIIGKSTENGISLEEVHRFSNDPVMLSGTFYWDTLRQFFEIKQGITIAKNSGGFDSIGIDTWGVDFGLIDSEGRLLENPVHYRDTRTRGIMDEVFKLIPKDEIYSKTGIQFMDFNTIFQLYYLSKYRPDLLKKADKFLFMPDLFGYFLTGEKSAEYTIASTSQLLDAKTRDWDFELIEKLGIPKHIFPKIIPSGSIKGMLKSDICDELSVESVPVVAIGSHDTASAVMAVPSENEDFIYVSCGTWSLFGTEAKEPNISEKSAGYNLTNEGGFDNKIRLLKNIMGLWLIQESRRQWIREGTTLTYADLEKKALEEEEFGVFIDPDYPDFGVPGNIPKHIKEYAKKTGQKEPENIGQIMRAIYESLALKYRLSFDNIKDVTAKNFDVIHIVGGGTKDRLLCQMTAHACNTTVIAGPIEATAYGNIIAQLISCGDIMNLSDARKIIKKCEHLIKYEPNESEKWNAPYEKYKKLLGV